MTVGRDGVKSFRAKQLLHLYDLSVSLMLLQVGLPTNDLLIVEVSDFVFSVGVNHNTFAGEQPIVLSFDILNFATVGGERDTPEKFVESVISSVLLDFLEGLFKDELLVAHPDLILPIRNQLFDLIHLLNFVLDI